MTIELIFTTILVILLIAQQAFYMWQVHTLLNKLMCRNYAEFALVESTNKAKPEGYMVPLMDEEDSSAIRELNNRMGLNTI